MKLFAVSNGIETYSDFGLSSDVIFRGSTNCHSGGIVILAETLEQAKKIAEKTVKKDSIGDEENFSIGTLKEIPFEKSGLVLGCNGNC